MGNAKKVSDLFAINRILFVYRLGGLPPAMCGCLLELSPHKQENYGEVLQLCNQKLYCLRKSALG